MSTKDVIQAIGREKVMAMFGVTKRTLDRANYVNYFTASWFTAIRDEMRSLDKPGPPEAWFNFKESQF